MLGRELDSETNALYGFCVSGDLQIVTVYFIVCKGIVLLERLETFVRHCSKLRSGIGLTLKLWNNVVGELMKKKKSIRDRET